MPGYNPPKNIPRCVIPAYVDRKANIKLIGPQGSNLKRITDLLKLDYVWINLESNSIELYASETKLEKAQKYFKKYLQTFYEKHCTKQRITEPPLKRMRFQ